MVNEPNASPANSSADTPKLPQPEILPPGEPAPAAAPPANSDDPSWGLLDIVAVLGAFCVAWLIAIFGLGIALGIGKMKPDQLKDARFLLPLQLFLYAVVFASMYVVVAGVRGRPFWREIRWNWPAYWVMYIPLGFVLALFTERWQSKMPVPKDVPMMEFFSNPTSAYLMGIIAVAFAPIIEELFFRGLLYPVLARWFRVWLAITITGVLFGFIHAAQLGWAWDYVLLLSIVGVVLTAIRARSGSVGASFVAHTAYNFTIFASGWLASDHFRHMERACVVFTLKP